MTIRNKTRLERLREFKYLMENHKKIFKKEVEFDMDTFGDRNLSDACGTAACALGSAALYPPFQKKGLVMPEAKPLIQAKILTLAA